jgi:MoaA/NifB/PqqE/SkfB family radical SAM enzyme
MLDRLAPCLSGLAISLDGLRRGHERLRGAGSFAPALRGIVLATRAPEIRVVVKTTVHRENRSELPALHRILAGLGIDEWHLFPVEAQGRAAGNASLLLTPREYRALCRFFDRVKADPRLHIEQNSFLRRRPADSAAELKRCNAGVSSLSVLADGTVTGCVLGMRSSAEAEGNVRHARLQDIWRHGFAGCRAASWRHCGRHRHVNGHAPAR